MTQRNHAIRSLAIAVLLGCSLPASAKIVTMNGLSIDLPEGFKASDSNRGIQAATPDDSVYVWFETYGVGDAKALIAEHNRFWTKKKVKLSGATSGDGKTTGGVPWLSTDYADATWRGDPTVIRYTEYGPFGSEGKYVLVTLWATPEGDKTFKDDIGTMMSSAVIDRRK